jgi:Tol biopolymer transport system component
MNKVNTSEGWGLARFHNVAAWGLVLCAMVAFSVGVAKAQPMRLVSAMDGSQVAPAGGGGDSVVPLLSADGRYVLFTSSANNLVLPTNGAAPPAPSPLTLNVYRRDRTNATTMLASQNLLGTGGGNGDSFPGGISSDGRFALFESTATNLVAGDTNNATDIFVRDLLNGVTMLVSVATNGTCANGASSASVITPDGRYVAFTSAASNLVADDTNGIADVFVRDLVSGVTTLVSVGAKTAPLPANSSLLASGSDAPDISPDGRYIAFFSSATNLVPGVTNVGDIYIRDRIVGATVWASAGARALVQSSFGASKALCFNHALSTNGQVVAFEAKPILTSGYAFTGAILRYDAESGITYIVSTNSPAPTSYYEDTRSLSISLDGRYVAFTANSNDTSGLTTCVKVWDASSGLAILASGDLSNRVQVGSSCDWASIDGAGKCVAFVSTATNLVTNSLVGDYHLYVRDLEAGVTTVADVNADGIGSGMDPIAAPALSANGKWIAFNCADSGLVADDRNRTLDVFVRDLSTNTLELVSAHAGSLPSLTPNGYSHLLASCVSSNARYVVFESDANNLVPNDTNGYRDIFVRDLQLGTNILVSADPGGAGGNGASMEPAMAAGGRYVVFTSTANNLMPGDANNASDVFVRDLETGTTTLVSANLSGSGSGNRLSSAPAISSEGRFVFYRSQATDLTSGSFTTGYENLFVRDLALGTNYVLTRTTTGSPVGSMTAGGRYVAFFGQRPNLTTALCLWDSQSASVVYSNTLTGIVAVQPSEDGSRIAYVTSSGPSLYFVERPALPATLIATSVSSSRPGLRFSGDARLLTYVAASPAPNTNRVYVHDFQTAANTLISRAYNPAVATDNVSDSPDISRDGRFIAYRSAATNLVPGDSNEVPDVFIYDRQSSITILLSASRMGSASADQRSLTPVFSGDGQRLLFQSWASDIVEQDFNQGADVFAYDLFASGDIPLFSAAVAPGAGGQGPWIIWPVIAGKNYRVQFKNNLGEIDWQDLTGGVTILGSQGYLNDVSAGAGPRFYRVVAY